MLLKPWHPLFDASRERVDSIPLWVRLPGLPLHYWTEEHLCGIGNTIGVFLEADLSFFKSNLRWVARILVMLNIREGLAESLNLRWGQFVIKQILDYEKVPFHCRRCHVYGHPAYECGSPSRKAKSQGSSPGVEDHFLKGVDPGPYILRS